MTLNQYAAEHRRIVFEDLNQGRSPSEGKYDEAVLRDAKAKGRPQMGSTVYSPDSIQCEFIFPDPSSVPTVLTVSLIPPERIVFLPVPEWVVESIWQGEIAGSYQFESDARGMIGRLTEKVFG